ncbi:hypothetical protein PJK45_04465 [Mycobacterium kansasii]|uniref:Uncharacterized protein n=2 Tax=Mycobacterium kansasii TaxID=1768 RepID=A0A653EZL3_MYCKA|nr:hypothetical protein [Mycobacterium kansasii]AGZ53881.1 hypothetical protein MKAN_28970 [Mycobacterium kansasii ATCC 12478]ARG54546.1 hypothetical protein B1T43_00155 [Mycobacterium kansasii]ARG59994.1 hypothetical protein B1T45_00180 [Mycobacterium kansasii]ARG67736.1 hypothetical protein B1T47_00315 [Mycobacterium kansasii]ARG77758.1 hypothetical protein B1T51_28550 [Mycobacterium kansasii]
MHAPRNLKTIIGGAFLSGGLAMAGLGLAVVTAQAQPGPVPLYPGPLHTDDSDWGPPKRWCPGDPLPETGNRVTDPFRGWDMSVCHTYYYLWPGMGNVSNMIWDGDDPPPKPPGSGYQPPPPLPPGLCWPTGSFIPVPIPCP